MKFYDETHEAMFADICDKMKRLDDYHKSVAYLLALDVACRQHINDLFDFGEDVIIREGLHKGWQTGTSQKTTRLMFNLWNGCSSDGDTYTDTDGYECNMPSSYYAVDEIFCTTYAPFYYEAIKLRYPRYCGED